MARIIDAILAINPSAKVVTRGSNIDTIEIDWLEGTVKISKADIQTKLTELQTAWDLENDSYKSQRKAEYPSIVDQLDDIYHNGIAGWKATIKITKDKYSKS